MSRADLVGQVLTFNEPDYMFGRGAVRIEVESLGPFKPDPAWLELHGREVNFKGIRGPSREMLVRATALPHQPK